ncbi:FAD-dependent oxidoreductase [Alpinimonas psychrophila]|uniref:NADPH-dependent 2,4-dienoyl-CoA reductase/sulfur reductase-like enzyme/rhodanese-related sulfurtransferase n=1 Tax=Alpinimonas psychrophila TaxID=748908 RepID=A0A7W3JT32_9MICO|nr:FAD-dependent oxidoreductase [Alpinimonas psychrophila]MBA8828657.1 NADPH-dependent 2,4-dienoyl-CoA reductase/sulfur reductase-like enzyme/rhodanese-related sulfurtransferase [Alpinimonas psychrophila]
MTKSLKTVIIGGVAGGMSAATRLRRLDETAEIVVLERSGYVSFANCGLPYHLGGIIDKRSALLLQTPQSLASRFGLDVRVNNEVIGIDPVAKTVTVVDVQAGTEYVESYDFLVLSPGASPTLPGVEGSDRALVLRDIEDVDRAMAALTGELTTAVVMGAGYIGIEVAENLRLRGLSVTIVQRGSQVLSSFDAEMASYMQAKLVAEGVTVLLGTEVSKIHDSSVLLSTGDEIPADVVFASIGVMPETSLAQNAGLTIGTRGGILVDEFQRTSNASIFAVGDAVEKIDAVTGESRLATLAGLANRHGHAVANVIAGTQTVAASPALGTAIVSFGSVTAASTGWTEKALRARGRDIRVLHTHPANHAGYYPGAETMHLKLIVDPSTDLILGAQAAGGAGVDKRMDVIATAMFASLTASSLAQLELSYSPQHGSAKDPINMLGYVNRNTAEGLTRTVQWHEVEALLESGSVLVDVRTETEHDAGHIPGGVCIPVDELRQHVSSLVGKHVIVSCQVGQRGHTAARLLAQHGIDVVNLDGGYLTWQAGAHATLSPSRSLKK